MVKRLVGEMKKCAFKHNTEVTHLINNWYRDNATPLYRARTIVLQMKQSKLLKLFFVIKEGESPNVLMWGNFFDTKFRISLFVSGVTLEADQAMKLLHYSTTTNPASRINYVHVLPKT